MQHSVSPYTLRCFNSSYVDEQPKVFHDGTRSTHYMKTNHISGHDLFALLVKFLEEHSTYTAIDNENKMLYKINGLQADKSNRTISGYMHKGNWGVPAHIQDANGKREPYAMSHDQAPMIAHYFYFSFPQDEQAAICVFHNIGNHGFKTVFEEKFGAARSAKCDILIEEDELSRENGQLKQPDFHNYIVKLVADIHSRIYR